VKEWLKSVLNYRSYPKIKSGYPFLDHAVLVTYLKKVVFRFLPRGQAASLYPSSSGLEAAGQSTSQQISKCRLEVLTGRAGRPNASG